ncbi:MAG TPA: hypothetical protein VIQ30_22675 [Pseudonocardia sp.]
MTEFHDIEEFLAPDLVLPIRGQDYRITAPDAETGLRIQAYWALGLTAHLGSNDSKAKAAALIKDDQEVDFYRDALGAAYDQMVKAKVPYPLLRHAAVTAMFDVVHGRATAQRYWNSPAGKATTLRSTSTSTAGATTTKRPASGSGTRSRKKKPRG